ncbi:DUF2130 domain-containing protein, partial [Candidatus Roizmanbacteria bacterium]|nr:DUF2130 domain-containing protein [Candidatus Roizmanbacteria bacterium]
ICPNCRKTIPLTQALSHQIREKYQKYFAQRLVEEKTKLAEEIRDQLTKKIKNEMHFQLKDKENEAEELQRQNAKLQEQLLELNRFIRQLKTEKEETRLELEKKLAVEQEKIRFEEKKRVDEEYRLKILEKEKQLQDALKMNNELKRKLEQGSQQTQGEVLELELERLLKAEFPTDEIKEVPKGVRGADILHIVCNDFGKPCGMIIWESKRAKAWTDGWVVKLKQDQRVVKADIAVIISQVLPDGVKNFAMKSEIFVCNYESIVGLTMLLRDTLIKTALVKTSMVGKKEKKEILWNYLTGIEFKQRIEAIYDAYEQIKEDLEKEKRWFTLKWAKQEKNISSIINNILGMSGDLQSIVGKSLPEIKGTNILPSHSNGDSEEKRETLF